ncbi:MULTISPECIES: hypothetical protein [unclassified Corallococcus]|uniref:hypothetical protein n=1 Tax=unclassified Corallococcus TaxID=2685029 RepID=UPI001A8DF8BD|nr:MULTISPECIES: hypothetical protein [unclassified Corallococcus]MBN9683615.1 hypothetical protein [Corallococcus sp. NCSPR001]WAS84873.1 hypothetical protein O0N60_37130 [Corallococcus sp. NCRR]
MSWRLLFLFLLCLSTGCGHYGLPPSTASHGHLSLAMAAYLDDPNSYERRVAQGTNFGFVTTDALASLKSPSVDVEPDQAPRVFEEVIQLLKGNPSDAELRRAFGELRAACDADYEKACMFLKEQVQPSVLLEAAAVRPMNREPRFTHAQYALIILGCRLEVDGRLRDCQVIESGPEHEAEHLIAQLSEDRYTPWRLAGHPMSRPYTFNFHPVYGSNRSADLSTELKLEWARKRVGWAPTSTSAWTNLAAQLAIHEPDHPHYPRALARAYALAPEYWWTATEMAWQHVQAGQHADALKALRPALRRSSFALGEHPNPYVLETAAAAHFGLKQCTEALAHQRKAVELLPAKWPAPERERFQARLQDYQAACATSPATP